MKLDNTQRKLYDQDKDYSFRNEGRSSASQKQTTSYRKSSQDDLSIPDFMTRRRSSSSRIRTNYDGDIAEFRTPMQKTQTKSDRVERYRQAQLKKKKAAQERFKKGVAAAMTIATLAGGIKMGGDFITRFDSASTNYDALNHTITEVAEWTGVDEKAILLANQMDNANEKVGEIVLPESYDPLEENISQLQERIEKDKLTSKERERLQEELDFLLAKKEQQEAIGEIYIDEDGKFVYIVPDKVTSAEGIKDAYGIKDGVLREYNDLDYTWGWDSEAPEHQGYKDYTESQTSGVRVPADEIGNFDD